MTAAGQRLGMTQSSVSQSLANLKQSMHVQLLDRSQRPPMLTPLGRHFYERATRRPEPQTLTVFYERVLR